MDAIKKLVTGCKCKEAEIGPNCPCHVGGCTCKTNKCKCPNCRGKVRTGNVSSSSESSSDDEDLKRRKREKKALRKGHGGNVAPGAAGVGGVTSGAGVGTGMGGHHAGLGGGHHGGVGQQQGFAQTGGVGGTGVERQGMGGVSDRIQARHGDPAMSGNVGGMGTGPGYNDPANQGLGGTLGSQGMGAQGGMGQGGMGGMGHQGHHHHQQGL